MYSYVIRMSLVRTRMLSVCHSYVLVCHPYVTRMYSHVIHMSLVCNRMSSVCHSYVVLLWTYESWHKLLINDSDKFINKRSIYKTYHIETSQSILTAYQLTGLHMQTSLYEEVSMNRLYKLHFLKHEIF